MSDLLKYVAEIESVLQVHRPGTNGVNEDRKRIRDAIQAIASISLDPSLTLTETINLAIRSCPSQAKRTLSAVMIRLVSASGPLTDRDIQKCRRGIVTHIEVACPNLTKDLFQPNNQNHEKIEAIKQIHYTACRNLDQLRESFVSLPDLAERRQSIMRSLKHGKTKSYLDSFGFMSILQLVDSLLGQVDSVIRASGHELQTKMEQLIEDIPTQHENCEKIQTFVTTKYALPFLKQLEMSATAMKDRFSADFACQISVPRAALKVEKRYPLHLTSSEIEIFIPLKNDGPGVAQNVTTYCVVEHGEVKNPETNFGSVNPGPFVLTLLIELTEPQTELHATIEVSWSAVGDSQRYLEDFTALIQGQRTDINWEHLSRQIPYSSEVVEDDHFYGRRDVLNRIIRRLTSNAMQSCYITGQKRVGKSSLACAVESAIRQIHGPESFHVLYLESGEIRCTTGEQTMETLGRRLDEYFSRHLSHHTKWEMPGYSSSLSSLNQLLEILRKENSHNRFIVILDEFDEINETLYSHGDLANTFFLNLRTLASKKNLAFVLVGAEKMPYLMSSQGEKLNKFVRESLDSFDQETEWSDFTSLVREPVIDAIVFHDSTLRRMYDLTDGHPYFTKVLCAKAFEAALDAKDAEISDAEIDKAGQRLLASLDTNAFAHYWRDGTRGGDEEVEIASVKRCRTLVSWARTVRSRKNPSLEGMEYHLHAHLRADELRHELDDFCRRGVFKEKEGNYLPTVDIFGRWLSDRGFALLVDGHLGDELEEKRRQDEDAAYVKSDEVVELVDSWPLYQGHRITEDRVRNWIDQVETNVGRRHLFKILQNVRFVTNDQMQESFRGAFENFRNRLPAFFQRKKTDRRHDVLVTFLGSAAKSGAYSANQFARANRIVPDNVIALERLEAKFSDEQEGLFSAIVVVDDMIGTGNTLSGDLKSHGEILQKLDIGSTIPLFVCAFCATVKGEAKVRQHLESTFEDSDLDICEMLEERHYAFNEGVGFWDSQSEKDKAKSMVMDLSARVDKRRQLGYSGQGLLLTFSRNCPNNSLPILYGHGKSTTKWTPLFPRTQL